tara:strand:- start:13703 stop:14323 length:621 start_codon:yes stop_codon:yes gene_type:complete
MKDNLEDKPFKYPTQKRTILRFNAILDFVEQSLSEDSSKSLSIYDIAEAMELPAPSIYRIFPNMLAIYNALVDRYLKDDLDFYKSIEIESFGTWQVAFSEVMRLAKERYENHPIATELMLGGAIQSQVKLIYSQNNKKLAYELAQKTKPYWRSDSDLTKEFLIAITMVESIWAISYQKGKAIDDFYFQESIKATINYLELYLNKFP